MNEQLKDIFSNINDWLKFAEAKTGTLLAGNGVLIFGILRIIKGSTIPEALSIYITFAIVLLSISMFLCLLSFVPSLAMPFVFGTGKPNKDDNILFFLDAAKYTTSEFLIKLAQSKGIESNDFSEHDHFYAEQIISNSQIALKKYKLFNAAIWLTITAIFTPIVSVITWMINKLWH
ncbi:MAG: Pycsar system effector family protein [Candidatus Thiodiazotropha sp.]